MFTVVEDRAGRRLSACCLLYSEPDFRPTRAAVSPALAAEIYGPEILARDNGDEHHNTTRFLIYDGGINTRRRLLYLCPDYQLTFG